MVKKLPPATSAQTNGTGEASDDYVGSGDYHVMSFDIGDVADFNVNNVVLDKSQAKGQNGTLSSYKNAGDRYVVTSIDMADIHRLLQLPHRYRHFRQHGHSRTKPSKMGADRD